VCLCELTVAAEATLFACQRVAETGEAVLLGLPLNCRSTMFDGRVWVQSLIAGEHDLHSYAFDYEKVLTKVKLSETLNPVARGFRALNIAPTK
jgi:hypothetical protein